MLQAGDMAEHYRGRWKGRRVRVVGRTRLGAIDVVDAAGRHSTIIGDVLKPIRHPQIRTWLQVWHSLRGNDRVVFRRAVELRSWLRFLGKYGLPPESKVRERFTRRNISLDEIEWFLIEFIKFSISPTR